MGLVLGGLAVAGMIGVAAVGYAESTATTVATPRFTDSFDGAVDTDPTYGLNDSVAGRQHGEQRGVTYTRVSGVWYPASPPRAWYSQVNHVHRRGALSFWKGHSAVRMDAPVRAGGDGRTYVTATVDPVNGDTGSGQWASVVLSPDAQSSGYVTNSDVAIGVIVRSDGRVAAFHRGQPVPLTGTTTATPDSNGRFRTTVIGTPGQRGVTIEVNGATMRGTLANPLPAANTLFLGAYLDDSNATSTVHHLAASAVDTTGLTSPASSGLRHFGYFAARLTDTTGNHLPQIAGRSNRNHVNISDYSRYAPEVLDSCRPASCVVYTGFEFFTGCDAEHSPDCRLYPDYAARWQRLADAVRPKLDKVAAFYLLDEPYHHGARPADVATAARTIKQTFPNATVMLVEAGYQVSTIEVPAEVDWVGFDEYCKPVATVEGILNTLEARTRPEQKLFLFPQAAPLGMCGGAPGYGTDEELARLQWDYLALAERHPRVAGLMTFGVWVEGTSPSQLPATTDAHERIAARITTRR